ncbi:hypothetical protein T05_13255 [Trichinella murrelli]|uniref:Uncharacterized protein n=1 Tax=Trichinella murrelli TaxID=144512 RepID=A0A0V0TMJ0_9BILA|nr:hypothetical protein T05_13255 [Trichinella murrelli]
MQSANCHRQPAQFVRLMNFSSGEGGAAPDTAKVYWKSPSVGRFYQIAKKGERSYLLLTCQRDRPLLVAMQ